MIKNLSLLDSGSRVVDIHHQNIANVQHVHLCEINTHLRLHLPYLHMMCVEIW